MTIRQRNDLAFTTEIPDDGVAGGTGAGEDVLDLLVPGDGGDFVEFCAARSGSGGVGLAWVFEIPDVHLS